MPATMTTAQASGPGFSALLTSIRDVYSAEIYFTALPNLRFDQFATRKEELGASPGARIVLPKMGGLKRGGALTEGQRIVPKTMSMSESYVTVGEQGNAIAMTERLLQTSFYDNMAAASMLLGRDMSVVLDLQLRDVARSGSNKVYAGGAVSRNTVQPGSGFMPLEVHKANEQLETQNAPKWNSDFYVCFSHPHQLTAMRLSAGWINAQLYAGSQGIFYGEVGRYNDFRFVSSSVMPNGAVSTLDVTGDYADPGYDSLLDKAVTVALQTNIYQAIAFGEYSYGHAIGLNVELRDNGTQDFGREHALAWYSIWGSALLEANNSVIIETA